MLKYMIVAFALLLSMIAISVHAEPPAASSPEAPAVSPHDVPFYTNLDDIPEHMRPQAELRGAQVPYAKRAMSLLTSLGDIAEADEVYDPSSELPRPLHMALETIGLDPDSNAAQELVRVSKDFKQWYIPATRASLRTGSYEIQHETQLSAARVAGQAFGKWLGAREVEDWAITPLVERLLNGSFSSNAVLSTHETQAELEKATAEIAASFREGLQLGLGWVPRRFQ